MEELFLLAFADIYANAMRRSGYSKVRRHHSPFAVASVLGGESRAWNEWCQMESHKGNLNKTRSVLGVLSIAPMSPPLGWVFDETGHWAMPA